MRLLIDMNLSPALCTMLEAAGFDATHWSDVGKPDAADTVLSPETVLPLLVGALRQFSDELLTGALVTIQPERMRARVLPIR